MTCETFSGLFQIQKISNLCNFCNQWTCEVVLITQYSWNGIGKRFAADGCSFVPSKAISVANIYSTKFLRIFIHYYFRWIITKLQESRTLEPDNPAFLKPNDSWIKQYHEGKFKLKRVEIFFNMFLERNRSKKSYLPVKTFFLHLTEGVNKFMDLFEASGQWANRPPDERFSYLPEMLKACNKYQEEVCQATSAFKLLKAVADEESKEENKLKIRSFSEMTG